MGKAKREVRRWERKKHPPANVVVVRGRRAREISRQLQAPAQPSQPQPQRGTVAQMQVFRFRYHLIPFAWLAGMLAAGLGTWKTGTAHAGLIAALAAAAVIVLLCRHLKGFTFRAAMAMAALTAACVPVLASYGPKPMLAVTLAAWACVAVPWMRRYRWRPLEPPAVPDTTDYERWNALAQQHKWEAHLGTREDLPGGGRRYPIQADGIKTVIGTVLSRSDNVAGAWHKPTTEAYVERDPTGVTSRGFLTVLGTTTLMKGRHWNGGGIDPVTGLAVVGRYADGSPVHLKFYTPRYGTRHGLVSGTTGAGKSETLNLLIFIALASGMFVPIILDPQNGQSLPFWRGRCLYAEGEDECRAMLAGLRAGMMDRSTYLASLRWDDDGIPMRGMPFFDHALTGLPMPLIIFDEAHLLLNPKLRSCAVPIGHTVDIARLGRKTGDALWLATHIPSLQDLGGEQALRDMLRGGNVMSMRTANRVASGMLGLAKDPSEIPMFFADGKETYGLGYTSGPDARPDAPMRTDLVPASAKRKLPPIPQLDDRFREAMDREMNKSRIVSVPPPAALAPAATVAEDDAPEGRKATDAVLAVLDGEMDRGEIATRVMYQCASWDRKPFSIRAISGALDTLTTAGKIRKVRHGVYAPKHLHLVGEPK